GGGPDEDVCWHVSGETGRLGWYRAGDILCTKWVWAVQHDRQRVGVDGFEVHIGQRVRCVARWLIFVPCLVLPTIPDLGSYLGNPRYLVGPHWFSVRSDHRLGGLIGIY